MRKHSLLQIVFLLAGFGSSVAVADLGVVSGVDWDATAVRRVLHTFAYGGFASDMQIQVWADMTPQLAIVEMLTFSPVNDRLSPPEMDNIQSHLYIGGTDRTLQGLHELWMNGSNPDNHFGPGAIATFTPLNPGGSPDINNTSLKAVWISATNKRGVNPFRQRVGLWLTNYLMSVHMDAIGNFVPLRTLYDETMSLLGQNRNFAFVLGDAAASSAMSVQYGHRNSRYVNGVFYGNDDFAREFHQLFFGINGVLDGYPETSMDAINYKKYYENVTIEGAARALTGMSVNTVSYYGSTSKVFSDQIDFQSAQNVSWHHAAPVEALNYYNPGTPNIFGATAEAKLANLSQLAINDPESERNLPVMIASHFADDNLSEGTKAALRSGWLASGKNLLAFLRAYAISPEFHNAGRIKYLTAFDRNMRIYTQNTVDNSESYLNYLPPIYQMESQGAIPFYPAHFVFGGQTSLEASTNSQVFKEAYNANVMASNFFGAASNSNGWVKNWAKLIPKNVNGKYVAADVARWLWDHFIGDGGESYGPQENAFITALLATGGDFLLQASPGNPVVAGYSDADLQTNPSLAAIIAANGSALLNLDSANAIDRLTANIRVGMAVNFITVTPFMFVQRGK